MTVTDSPTSVTTTTTTLNPRLQNKARIHNLIRRVKSNDDSTPNDGDDATMSKAKAEMHRKMAAIAEVRTPVRRTKSSDTEGRTPVRRTKSSDNSTEESVKPRRTTPRRHKSTDGSIQPSLFKGRVKATRTNSNSSEAGRTPARRVKSTDGSMDASKGRRIKAKRTSSKGEFVAETMRHMDSFDMIAMLELAAQNDNEIAFDAFQSLRSEERENDPSERGEYSIR